MFAVGKPIVRPLFSPCTTTPEIVYVLPISLFASSSCPFDRFVRICVVDTFSSVKAYFTTMVMLNSVYSVKRSEEHTSELQSRFDLVCRLRHDIKRRNL